MERRLSRLAPALALMVALVLFAGDATVSRAGIPAPPPDDTGSFVGTWYYTDPGFRIAIFISEDKPGVFTFRYHVRDKAGKQYETDALGKAKYVDGDDLIQVTFTAKVEGPNKITGRHERVVQNKDGSKIKESGSFEVYRAEYSRKLVLRYPEWKTELYSKSGRLLSTNLDSDMVRLFRRASEIVVDFDEIKF